MAEAIKDTYNYDSIKRVAVELQTVYAPFRVEEFLSATLDETWDALELKDRFYRISERLGRFLPSDFGEAIGVIDKVVASFGTWLDGFCIFFPGFVELYGLDEASFDISVDAMARYTQFASAEFAVRAFIIKYGKRMMERMYAWSRDESEHVRRLASEGCRPALPWGQALNEFKRDPTPILPILEQLKADPELFVRRSVANNLNDISKTHPELVARLAREWYGKDARTDWVVKHACRTLLKKGNREVLALFGYKDAADVAVQGLALGAASVEIGEELEFSFEISTAKETKVRLEYAIDYVKANGKRSRKIFKISESTFKENAKKQYTKRHSFADLSTRKHYAGVHSVALLVNGAERGSLDFDVLA